MEAANATMLSTSVAVSAFAGDDDTCAAPPGVVTSDVTGIDAGAWLLLSGCVCCIFTVAFGKAGPLLFGASLGRLMRAVSFFGETGFAITPTAPGGGGGAGGALGRGGADIEPVGGAGGPGRSGIVGLLLSAGGFGGDIIPLVGFEIEDGGAGGPGGFGGGGGVTPEPGTATFDVSFFGVWISAWMAASGTLTRTVSRFATG
jgi:hypothetical protein